MANADCQILNEAIRRERTLGTTEFFLREADMRSLVQHLLGRCPGTWMSLNNTHALGRGFLHRAEWMGLKFVSVSARPFMVA
ncbi:MAG TPA: hypothetical protein PK280_02575 [Planctomycetota bacterium]|nr:hypothetical protein [Planctomycetota bacterium]